MFWTRLFSGVVLILLALATIITGNDVLLGTVLIISIIGLYEIYKVAKIEKSPLGFVGYIVTCVYYYMLREQIAYEWFTYLILGLLILIMTVYVIRFPKYNSEHILFAFFGFFYVPMMLSYVYQTRMLEEGKFLVWLIFICSWGADTCAYCVGMLIGKHKMTPRLSPKKSIEGAIGGIIGAGLIGCIYAVAVGGNVIYYGIIGACGSVISIIGDLAASAIKRNHDVKDYGKLIPGHGGVLDRFDSVIFTAPVIYFLAMVIIK